MIRRLPLLLIQYHGETLAPEVRAKTEQMVRERIMATLGDVEVRFEGLPDYVTHMQVRLLGRWDDPFALVFDVLCETLSDWEIMMGSSPLSSVS